MYTIQNSKVFHYDVEVQGANAATFVALNNTWGKDAKNAFCRSHIKSVKDVDSFEALNECYARDKFHVYVPAVNFDKADRDSFAALDPGIAPLRDLLLTNIHFIGGYGKDKNHVYFLNVTVKLADPQTFQSLRNRFGLDSRNAFFEGKNLHVKDIASWRPVALNLSCDRLAVYRGDKVVKGADPRTLWLLPPLEEGCFRDHAAFYCTNFPGSADEYYRKFQEKIAHYTNLLHLFEKRDYFSTQFHRAVPPGVRISDKGLQS